MLLNVSLSQVDTTQYDDFLHEDILGFNSWRENQWWILSKSLSLMSKLTTNMWTKFLHITRILHVTILVAYQFWHDPTDDLSRWTISHNTFLVDAISTQPIYYKNRWLITYKDHICHFIIFTEKFMIQIGSHLPTKINFGSPIVFFITMYWKK